MPDTPADQAAPMSPEREAEIREWEAELGKGKSSAGVGPYTALRDTLAELDRVNAERERLYAQVQTVIELSAELLAERDNPQARADEGKLRALAQVRVWRNEDGRRFLYADDVTAALGIPDTADSDTKTKEATP